VPGRLTSAMTSSLLTSSSHVSPHLANISSTSCMPYPQLRGFHVQCPNHAPSAPPRAPSSFAAKSTQRKHGTLCVPAHVGRRSRVVSKMRRGWRRSFHGIDMVAWYVFEFYLERAGTGANSWAGSMINRVVVEGSECGWTCECEKTEEG
jgi:hypothetical protein